MARVLMFEPTHTGIIPSGHSTSEDEPYTIYVLGVLGYDFGTAANRDAFIQSGLSEPDNPEQLIAYLARTPWAAEGVIWTVAQEGVRLYAVHPVGPYAAESFGLLREILALQAKSEADIVAIPGNAGGSVTLSDGQEVPWLYPNPRGIYAWTREALIRSLKPEADDAFCHHVSNFLSRMYYEFRNRGRTARERALNYAATNAFQVARVCEDALSRDLALDGVDARPSPTSRAGSDCWDVELVFFDPKQLTRAKRTYRFTIDVSAEIPVTVGSVRHWDHY
jgi:cyanobactin maturation PatA/PatG family protease